MKKIKVKPEYSEFRAIYDGSVFYDLTHEGTPVNDEHLGFINEKYGALVEVCDLPIEEAIPVLQQEPEVVEKKEEEKAEDIKPKRTRKNGSNS